MNEINFVTRTPFGHTARVAEAFGEKGRLLRCAACGESNRIDVLVTAYGLTERAHFTCEEAEALAAELLLAVEASRRARQTLEVAP